jgi:gas vesicle structural protein
MPVERASGGTSLIDVLDRVLDKGIVIDAWVRVSLVGIDLITVEARVVVASIETYLRYAEALGITAPVSVPPVGTAVREELGPGDEVIVSASTETESPITRTRARTRTRSQG